MYSTILMISLFILLIYGIKKNLEYIKFLKKQVEIFKLEKLQIEIFNLGNSHSKCMFNYSEKNIEICNLACDSQTFYYDLKLLEKNEKNIKDKSICFFPISYFSFYSKRYWQYVDQFKYYQILSREELNNGLVEYFLKKKIPYFFIVQYKIKKKIKRILKKKYPKLSRSENHKRLILKNLDYLNENKEILTKILRILKSKNIKAILICPPFREDYKKVFSENFLKNYYENIINEYVDNSTVFFKDLSNFFSNEENVFIDDDHLNHQGSKLLQNYLLANEEWLK